eukprot:scaffold2742_cov167-Amphora_coffeaeformis.AAC.8
MGSFEQQHHSDSEECGHCQREWKNDGSPHSLSCAERGRSLRMDFLCCLVSDFGARNIRAHANVRKLYRILSTKPSDRAGTQMLDGRFDIFNLPWYKGLPVCLPRNTFISFATTTKRTLHTGSLSPDEKTKNYVNQNANNQSSSTLAVTLSKVRRIVTDEYQKSVVVKHDSGTIIPIAHSSDIPGCRLYSSSCLLGPGHTFSPSSNFSNHYRSIMTCDALSCWVAHQYLTDGQPAHYI